eukprot:10875537-Alexandrium_andersonii.AAC.1
MEGGDHFRFDWRPHREVDPQKGSYPGPNSPAKLAPLSETAKASILRSKLIQQPRVPRRSLSMRGEDAGPGE